MSEEIFQKFKRVIEVWSILAVVLSMNAQNNDDLRNSILQ